MNPHLKTLADLDKTIAALKKIRRDVIESYWESDPLKGLSGDLQHYQPNSFDEEKPFAIHWFDNWSEQTTAGNTSFPIESPEFNNYAHFSNWVKKMLPNHTLQFKSKVIRIISKDDRLSRIKHLLQIE